MNEETPHSPREPRRPLGIFWVVLLPLALLAGGLFEAYRQPASPLIPTEPPPVVHRRARPQPVAPRPVQTWIMVPNADATLQRVPVTSVPLDSTSTQARVEAAVPLLLRAAPTYFPPGAALIGPVKLVGDVAELNFNAQFAAAGFWQGSTRTTTAIYSIVNTVVANNNPKTPAAARRVRFLIEGKPVEVLGEFDTTDPVEPKPDMESKG